MKDVHHTSEDTDLHLGYLESGAGSSNVASVVTVVKQKAGSDLFALEEMFLQCSFLCCLLTESIFSQP